jgi:hypothetical protein
VTQIFHSGQPSRGCDRKPFEVGTNVHQPTVLHTKKEYGMIIFVPQKIEKNDTNDVTTGYFLRRITMIDISRGFKQVSLPRDFGQKS